MRRLGVTLEGVRRGFEGMEGRGEEGRVRTEVAGVEAQTSRRCGSECCGSTTESPAGGNRRWRETFPQELMSAIESAMEAVPCDPLRSGDLALTQRWLPFSHLVFDLLPICVLHIDTQCPDRQHKASHRSQAVQAVRILQDRNRGLGTSWAVR